MPSNVHAVEILAAGARALAHVDGLRPRLEMILGVVAEHLRVESAAVFVTIDVPGALAPAAWIGLSDAALAGLEAAVRNPAHPIARTAADRATTFNVAPTAPGGPALRSHLPLIVTRDGAKTLVGVAAFAHEEPIGDGSRPLMIAAADLAAVAIEQGRAGTARHRAGDRET